MFSALYVKLNFNKTVQLILFYNFYDWLNQFLVYVLSDTFR